MTNATKTLSVIFVVLVICTVAVKWSSGPEASHAFRSNLMNVDTAKVTKMVISNPVNPTITMERKDHHWQVQKKGQQSYPADGGSIRRAIDRLNNLSVNVVATRNPKKYTRYKVDSTGIKVSLYNHDKLLGSIYVGAPKRAGRRSLNNYVRPAGDQAVYSVDGFLRATFAKKMDDWRDKVVWDVPQSNISRVDFLYPADSSFSIKKVANKQWVSTGDTLSRSAISLPLSRLSTLRASGFADSVTVKDFGTEKYAIQIGLSDGEQHRLRLKEFPADSTVYLATSKGFPYVFTLRKKSWDHYVLKSKEELD